MQRTASSKSSTSQASKPVSVIGAGIAGTWQALLFAKAGCSVTIYESSGAQMTEAASHWAGGMLAPWCEGEAAEPLIARLGQRSIELWRSEAPDTPFNGSLVVAHPRDRADYERFARLTSGHRRLDSAGVAAIEPDLAGRFYDALFFEGEGHVEPRRVLPALHRRLLDAGVSIVFDTPTQPQDLGGTVIDCRGRGARDTCPALRGVKGEMVVVETAEVGLSRPVRLLHPRWPLYVVPRPAHRFMIGATTIESEDTGVSVRSALELLTAAYALHPAFAEARIVEIGSGLRPAFPDNLPRITVGNTHISVNGLYRHGFLLAPALAELTVSQVLHGQSDSEVFQWS